MNPELVKFHLPTTDQFPVAVDNRYHTDLAHALARPDCSRTPNGFATSIDDPGSRLCADPGQHPTTPDGYSSPSIGQRHGGKDA
jgi:hypothetical protein